MTTSATSVSPTARTLWRRNRAVLLACLLVLLAAVATAWLARDRSEGRRLDPRDTSTAGSAALAALLEEEGVRVHRVTTADEAAALATPRSLLLITKFVADPAEAHRLAALPSDRMLVGDQGNLDILAPGVKPEETVRVRSREPGCALDQARRAGSAHLGGAAFTAPPGATGCYPSGDRPTLVRYAEGTRTITVAGDGEFMTNLYLTEDGNAALAMNLAGQRPELIWLTTPAPGDPGYAADQVAGSRGRDLWDLLPPGVGWAVAQLCVAVLLAAIWQGRRLGPVVAERLPVVVRAAETAEGLGRLYRARRARDRAAAALRAACLDRVTPRLGLGRAAGPDEVITTLASRTGEDAARLRTLLYGPAPAGDAALAELAAGLDAIEDRLRREPPPASPAPAGTA